MGVNDNKENKPMDSSFELLQKTYSKIVELEEQLKRMLGVELCNECGNYVNPSDLRRVNHQSICLQCDYARHRDPSVHPFDQIKQQ